VEVAGGGPKRKRAAVMPGTASGFAGSHGGGPPNRQRAHSGKPFTQHSTLPPPSSTRVIPRGQAPGLRRYIEEEKEAYMAKYPAAPERDVLVRLEVKYRKLKPDAQAEYEKQATKPVMRGKRTGRSTPRHIVETVEVEDDGDGDGDGFAVGTNVNVWLRNRANDDDYVSATVVATPASMELRPDEVIVSGFGLGFGMSAHPRAVPSNTVAIPGRGRPTGLPGLQG